MENYRQMALFPISSQNGNEINSHLDIDMGEWGTFKDSLRAPVHRWFAYPAGFSYQAVQYAIRRYAPQNNAIIYDPFTGTGTMNVVAKQMGIDSIGIEAHPFIYSIAKVKVYWEFDMAELGQQIHNLLDALLSVLAEECDVNIDSYPELIKKCYDPEVLIRLSIIKKFIEENVREEHFRDLC
jgi:hypothetical protein